MGLGDKVIEIEFQTKISTITIDFYMLGRPYFIGNKLTFLIEMTAFLDANHTHSSNPLCNVMNADNPFVKNTAVLFISAK